MAGSWEGFWQLVYERDAELIVSFRDTTTAVRPNLGFSVQTHDHLLELRSNTARQPPQGWPPTQAEAVAMLRGFGAYADRTLWEEKGGRLYGECTITMASDPRLEGETCHYELDINGEHGFCRRTMPDGSGINETWRRMSGPGGTPLAGSWESGDPDDLWIYLVTAGHYGVMRTSSDRPRRPQGGEEYSDEEIWSLWQGFGANAGARLETQGSFDHWPMLGQVAGYEVRKHETFRIDHVEESRFLATLPIMRIRMTAGGGSVIREPRPCHSTSSS